MPFRDRALTCPRCHVDLIRDEAERDAWECPRCGGTALGVGDLIDDLLKAAPQLRPIDGVRDLVTVSRRALGEVACPACGQPMGPVYLAGLEIDRCHQDQLLWMSRGQRTTILRRAEVQEMSRPLDHLRVVFLGPDARATSTHQPSGVAVFFATVALLAAFPLGLYAWMILAFNGLLIGSLALLVPATMLVYGITVIVRALR